MSHRRQRILQWLQRNAQAPEGVLALAHQIANSHMVDMGINFFEEDLPTEEAIEELTRILAGDLRVYLPAFRAINRLEQTGRRHRLVASTMLNSYEWICFTTTRGNGMLTAVTIVSPPDEIRMGRIETLAESNVVLWCIAKQMTMSDVVDLLHIATQNRIQRGVAFMQEPVPALSAEEWEQILAMCINQGFQTFYRIAPPDAELARTILDRCLLRGVPVPDWWLRNPATTIFAIRTDMQDATSLTSYFCVRNEVVYSGN